MSKQHNFDEAYWKNVFSSWDIGLLNRQRKNYVTRLEKIEKDRNLKIDCDSR